MNAARIRISRVRMKNGGADVTVIQRNPDAEIIASARRFVRTLEGFKEPPTAFVAIAFWPSDDNRQPHIIEWDTIDRDISLPRLMKLASTQISDEAAVLIAEYRIMKKLGYRTDDDAS